jgi:hypothetical protein
LAVNTLAKYISALSDDADVAFSFDGSVLSIRCDGKVVALAGEGVPWTVRFKVLAGSLRQLPKRLMRDTIEIAIWESRLSIANWSYPGTLVDTGSASPSKIQ